MKQQDLSGQPETLAAWFRQTDFDVAHVDWDEQTRCFSQRRQVCWLDDSQSKQHNFQAA